MDPSLLPRLEQAQNNNPETTQPIPNSPLFSFGCFRHTLVYVNRQCFSSFLAISRVMTSKIAHGSSKLFAFSFIRTLIVLDRGGTKSLSYLGRSRKQGFRGKDTNLQSATRQDHKGTKHKGNAQRIGQDRTGQKFKLCGMSHRNITQTRKRRASAGIQRQQPHTREQLKLRTVSPNPFSLPMVVV